MPARGEDELILPPLFSLGNPADVTAKSMDNLVHRYSQCRTRACIRKGKVPSGVIRKLFAEDKGN